MNKYLTYNKIFIIKINIIIIFFKSFLKVNTSYIYKYFPQLYFTNLKLLFYYIYKKDTKFLEDNFNNTIE